MLSAVCASAKDAPADSLGTTGTPGLIVNGETLGRKAPGDLRNQLTGLVPGLEVTEISGCLWSSDGYEDFNIDGDQWNVMYRGNSNLTCFIDGMLVPISIYSLDPSQIESVRLAGSIVDRAKLGPTASNGALYITTKRGGYNTPLTVNVTADAGIAMTGLVPEWADGVDYAILNNQARANAGYVQQYSPKAIDGYLAGNASDLLYPCVDYRSLIMKNAMPIGNASISFSGGGDKVKYAAAISELYSGDIVNTSDDQDYNRINISSNVTSRINNYLEVNAGFNSTLSFRRGSMASWNDWQSVPPVAYPLTIGTNDASSSTLAGATIYGSTANWPDNPYANLVEGGSYTRRLRSAMIYANVGFDLDQWVKGLRSDTYVAYSNFMATTVKQANDYLSYYWDPTAEDGKGTISPTHQGEKSSSKSISSGGASQILQFSEKIAWDRTFGEHVLHTGASFLMMNATLQSVGYYKRIMQLVGDFSYSWQNRFFVEGALQYAGSSRFSTEQRFKPFGSLGAAWVVSNEEFLKDCSWIDKLKLRAQYGTMGDYDSTFGTQYLYDSDYAFANGVKYGPLTTIDSYFGSKSWTSQKTTINRLANYELTWESVTGWEAGVDFNFCHGFSFTANVYGYDRNGLIADVSEAVPAVYGLSGMSVYDNYTSNSTLGYEIALGYARDCGDWGFNAAVSLYHWDTKYKQLVSDDVLYDYQKQTGTSTSAYWGLQCIGKYETQEQVETIPSYGSVQIGDLMYKDQNGDGMIDDNDKTIVGSTQPDLRASLSIGLRWKNLELQIIGTGQFGMDVALTGDYFWSGWGDGNYSAFVRDNIGGDYPRLSYLKSTNNFVESDFWLRHVSWFKIQDAVLSYNVPLKSGKGLKGLKIQFKGNNLATFTNLEYIDPEANTSGISAYPLYRNVTAGFKIIF